MKYKDTGGPAFPMFDIDVGKVHEGMTLRDYFAAKCLNKIGMFPETLKLDTTGRMTAGQIFEFERYINASSRLAYQMADAMLKARGD